MKENISYTISNDLCLGCGICSDVCPTKSIHSTIRNGEYIPYINNETCINLKGCHRCSTICPGLGVKLASFGENMFGSSKASKSNPLIGFYHSSYSGFSTDHEVRYHGASGGLLTSFLAFLLDKKMIYLHLF